MKITRDKTTHDGSDAHRVVMRCGVSTLGINAIVIVEVSAMMSSVKSRVDEIRMIVGKVTCVGVGIHGLSVRWIYAVVIVRCGCRSNRIKGRKTEDGMILGGRRWLQDGRKPVVGQRVRAYNTKVVILGGLGPLGRPKVGPKSGQMHAQVMG